MGFDLIYWNPIMCEYFLEGFLLEKYGKTFVQAATTGLGKYRMGAYGQIGVYREYFIFSHCVRVNIRGLVPATESYLALLIPGC